MAKNKTVLRNHVVLIIDESGSMGHLRQDVVNRFNDQLDTIREQSKVEGQSSDVSIYTFNYFPKRIAYVTDVDVVRPLTVSGYSPGGQTALYDCIGNAIEDMNKLTDVNFENSSFLFVIITDGAENNSRNYTQPGLNTIIRNKQQTDRWSFTALVPPGGEFAMKQLGIPAGNIRPWEATQVELERASVHTQSALSSYFVGRSAGVKSVSTFYQTDMSKINTAAVQTALVDVTSMFRKFNVDREADIQAFLEYKTNKPYRMGDGFYELTKNEKIQPSKEILVLDRGNNKLYAGVAARDLLSLPKDVEFRVKPGNHANYKIFVQSKSPNRKLVRGTTLYYKKA